jgi:hypothetical protein
MTRILRIVVLAISSIALLPFAASAQEASLSGTVTDATGGVLPGVVVRAVRQDSGNSFESVTDGVGTYRLLVRVGVYQITAELAGFVTVNRSGLELLVGQQATINFQMAPSALQETVTVTGEAPLVETSSSSVSSNIDPRQMTDLPVNGRNWQDLLSVAPGARYNTQQLGDSVMAGTGFFQLNVDGQQVTQTMNAGSSNAWGQPRFSQDAIAEIEYVSNRFDASQGRSMGIQVNAVTKSGGNTPTGMFAGFFREDSWNARDHVAKQVLPYSDQQLSTTFGGPIRRDRMLFVVSFEYVREPQSLLYTTPVPAFNQVLTGTRVEKKGLVKVDVQFSPKTRLAVRGSAARSHNPYEAPATGLSPGTATSTPNAAQMHDRKANQLFATLTRVIGSRAVNEIKVGYNYYHWLRLAQTPYTSNSVVGRLAPNYEKDFASLVAPYPLTVNFIIQFSGLNTGGGGLPQLFYQADHTIRDDFTFSYNGRGRHDVKLGAEYLNTHHRGNVCQNCLGQIDAQGGPLPANMLAIFPNLLDMSTWNLNLFSPIVRRFTQSIGDVHQDMPRYDWGTWAQDDWALTQRLTINLGVRYDRASNAYANTVEILPFLPGGRPDDRNNWAPRFGFAYTLTPRTVIRGGAGKYFAETNAVVAFFTERAAAQATVVVNNDGRPDFASNPYNGAAPATRAEALRIIQQRNLQLDLQNLVMPKATTAYSYQTSLGVQHQLNALTGVQADYVFTGARADFLARNVNLAYNPATGVNYPFSDRAHLPYPAFGVVTQNFPEGYSNYHALQTAVTRRLGQGWQGSATYTLAYFRDGRISPAPEVTNLAPDLGADHGLGATDQRHRAVFNGIWQMKYGFQLSGIYFYGSGERLATTYGGDTRLTGDSRGNRLRPNGTIVPRNNFVGKPIHRVDTRIQKRFALRSRVKLDGIAEVFNVLNHANFGSYVTQENNSGYGKPTQNNNIGYQARTVQFGFRAAF